MDPFLHTVSYLELASQPALPPVRLDPSYTPRREYVDGVLIRVNGQPTDLYYRHDALIKNRVFVNDGGSANQSNKGTRSQKLQARIEELRRFNSEHHG